jgi:hypothetical protein
VAPPLADRIQAVAAQGFTLTELDFELIVGGGRCGPEAELAGAPYKIAILAGRDLDDRAALDAAGWKIFLRPVEVTCVQPARRSRDWSRSMIAPLEDTLEDCDDPAFNAPRALGRTCAWSSWIRSFRCLSDIAEHGGTRTSRLGGGSAGEDLPIIFVRFTCADEIDGFVTILRVNLFHHAVDVVLDGEFGQIQVGGDLFVA